MSTRIRPSGRRTASSKPPKVSGVEEAQPGVCVLSGLYGDELVAADPGVAVGQGRYARPAERYGSGALVHHYEVVAGAMHLVEGDPHAAAYSLPLITG
jgi:hypothetical protein